MIDNKEIKHKDIKLKNTKYFFTGFIIGIIPFMIILGIMALYQGGIQYIPAIFKNTLIISGIVTSIINSFTFYRLINLKFL